MVDSTYKGGVCSYLKKEEISKKFFTDMLDFWFWIAYLCRKLITMIAYSLKEAYAKCITMCVIERTRQMSMTRAAELFGVSNTQVKSFEEVRVINLQLLKDYMDYFGIAFSCEIEKME